MSGDFLRVRCNNIEKELGLMTGVIFSYSAFCSVVRLSDSGWRNDEITVVTFNKILEGVMQNL